MTTSWSGELEEMQPVEEFFFFCLSVAKYIFQSLLSGMVSSVGRTNIKAVMNTVALLKEKNGLFQHIKLFSQGQQER